MLLYVVEDESYNPRETKQEDKPAQTFMKQTFKQLHLPNVDDGPPASLSSLGCTDYSQTQTQTQTLLWLRDIIATKS